MRCEILLKIIPSCALWKHAFIQKNLRINEQLKYAILQDKTINKLLISATLLQKHEFESHQNYKSKL